MKKLITACVVFVMFSAVSAFGWGQKGHDIVAYIAQSNMNKKSLKAVHKALGGHTLMYYSSWMDNVRDHPGYEETVTWHYANVNEGETYASMLKESRGDVYTALTMVIEKLEDRKNLTDSLETTYLRFLIHLVGDLHCPMHAGRLTDRGGNSFKIQWFSTPTNIHSLWDSALIESVRKWSYTEWRDNIDYLSKEEKKRISGGTLLDWLNETVAVCKNIYMGAEEGANYSWDYMFHNYPVLELQLQKAGYRLASILERLYP